MKAILSLLALPAAAFLTSCQTGIPADEKPLVVPIHHERMNIVIPRDHRIGVRDEKLVITAPDGKTHEFSPKQAAFKLDPSRPADAAFIRETADIPEPRKPTVFFRKGRLHAGYKVGARNPSRVPVHQPHGFPIAPLDAGSR